MAEEKKPIKVTLKFTLPSKETLTSAIRQMFPFVEVSIEEEKKPEEAPHVKPEG